MKKSFLLLLLCISLVSGCQSRSGAPGASPPGAAGAENRLDKPADELPHVVRVAALNGPTAMGMVKLMDDAEAGKTGLQYAFTIAVIDEIVASIGKGEVDIAAVPANMGAVLYKNTGNEVQAIAINTLGVLYVVEKGETIRCVSDLGGRTVLATGQGAIPEYALNYVLTQNGLDPAADLTIEFKSEPAEVIPLLAQSDNGVALLPQPFVTTALEKVDGLRVALDLTEEWSAVSADKSQLVTGIALVRKEFAEQYPQAVASFLEEYEASARYCETNVQETADLVEKYGTVPAAIAVKALPACNITCMTGVDMQTALEGYFQVLYGQNPQSVGGTLPDEGFYYIP